MPITKESAIQWVREKLVNPDTGKKIKKNGPKYKEFLQAATDYGVPLSVKVFKRGLPAKGEKLDKFIYLFIQNGTYLHGDDSIEYSPLMVWWTGQKRHRQGDPLHLIDTSGFKIGFKVHPTGEVKVLYDPNKETNYWKPIGDRLGKLMETYMVVDS